MTAAPSKRATGTPIVRALALAPEPETLPLDEHVPCPGRRFGKAQVFRATLLKMRGDESFVIHDATLVYVEAKKLGITITTRREGEQYRVWRIR